ncbi:hypothetical protein RHMOL_Rhmol02G0180900 [Rhododendron molle]|uniref:Uncharacterized protein n=1 Tax=Rhododendron molle TaxID=49168 RepID=A0ACC0PT73_RHOML|nr:hypothetical protein RHMOL_Rhmol02G0180900 [Rhododendron molle]
MHQRGMLYPKMPMEDWYALMNNMSPHEIVWRHRALNILDMATNSAGFARMVIARLSSFTFYIPGRILRQLGMSQGLNRAGVEAFHVPAFTAQNLTGYEHNWGLRQLEGADPDFSTTLKHRYKAWLRKEVAKRQNVD